MSDSTPRKSSGAKARPAKTATKPRIVEPVDPKSKKPTEPTSASDGKDAGTSAATGSVTSGRSTGSADRTAVIPAVKDAAATSATRKAHLRLAHVDPWSVTRLAFVVSVAMMIVAVVAVSIFWIVLEITGVWGQVNDSVTSVLSDSEGSFDITDYLGFGRLFGLTLVLSAINVVLMTALATIAAHLYNLGAQLLGGIEVTFRED